MTIIRTITKTIATRAWHDLEPKVVAYLATGLTSTALIAFADYAGVRLDPSLAALVVIIVGAIAGYIKSSTSKVPPVTVVDPPAVEPAVVPGIITANGAITITNPTFEGADATPAAAPSVVGE